MSVVLDISQNSPAPQTPDSDVQLQLSSYSMWSSWATLGTAGWRWMCWHVRRHGHQSHPRSS